MFTMFHTLRLQLKIVVFTINMIQNISDHNSPIIVLQGNTINNINNYRNL